MKVFVSIYEQVSLLSSDRKVRGSRPYPTEIRSRNPKLIEDEVADGLLSLPTKEHRYAVVDVEIPSIKE